MATPIKLRRLTPDHITNQQYTDGIDPTTLQQAQAIIDTVKSGGVSALVETAVKFKDIESKSTPYILHKDDLKKAFTTLPVDQQQLLQRTAARVYNFATAQRNAMTDTTVPVLGGSAGHTVVAVQTAGCYAPGGRFPLPSSVLMTACTARAAGVQTVIVASPHPDHVTRAAAYCGGADQLLCVGGAQAVAAMAYGIGVPACDIICGPGNRWVTAAKKIVSGVCGIDMLAGPSELLVIGDHTSDPVTVAADLLAQAEHDTDARPILVTTDSALITRVEAELGRQLSTFPAANQHTAGEACKKGFAVLCHDIQQCIEVTNKIAPEHLEVLCDNSTSIGKQISKTGTYGGLFIGSNAAEVLGDYGCGPNHTLPTMSTARYTGGLSVFNFLRIRTWLQIDQLDDAQQLVSDAVALARLEGLEGHARSAERRLLPSHHKQHQQQNGVHINGIGVVGVGNGVNGHANGNGVNGNGNGTHAHTQALNDINSTKHSVTATAGASSTEVKALQYIRPDFGSLMEYSPVKPLDVLAQEIGMPVSQLAKLNANENLYGPLEASRDAARNSAMHIYPDPDQNKLRDELARVHSVDGLNRNNVVAGAGSDELLDLLFTLTDCKAVVTLPPTFSMYQFFALLHKADVIEIPRGNAPSNWAIDIDAVIKSTQPTSKGGKGASIVFIASPNNPTGDVISNTDVARLCEQCNALVVLDEAYAEFADVSAAGLINKYSNLIVLRTFSKWAGLAGMRIGYMLAHDQLIVRVMQIKQPYNINVAAGEAAIVALQQRQLILDTAVKAMVFERERMMVQLQQLGWIHPLPSQANFLLCELSADALNKLNGTPRTLQKALFTVGVLVRCYAGNSDSTLNNQIRISCGRPGDTDRLMNVLYDIQKQYNLNTDTNTSAQQRQLTSQYTATPAALLLDMDGVLADVSQSYRTAIIQTCAAYNVHITNADITDIKNAGNANNDWDVTHRLIQRHNKSASSNNVTYETVKAKFQELYLGSGGKPGLRDNERLIVDKQLLARLSKATKLAVVTGRPRDDCEYFLQYHGIKQYFEAVSCMEDGPLKPDASPVMLALQRLKIDAHSSTQQHVYMVGDTVDDINSALRANQQINNSAFTILPIGIPAPADAQAVDTARVLYQAGAARVLHTMEQLRELVLLQEYNIYAPSASISQAVATKQQQQPAARVAEHTRTTSETVCTAIVNIDGTGKSTIKTGLGFLDHMLTALSKHSRIDMQLTCTGDLWIDDHHTTEDTGITLGTAVAQALGGKRGIYRYGHAYAPLDESLARAVVDFSGRSSQHIDLQLKRDNVGDVSSEMLTHFVRSFADACKLTAHIEVIRGENDHHRAEASFKALALALRRAVTIDTENSADLPSTKGAL